MLLGFQKIMLNNNAGRVKPSCIIFHKIREFSLVCPVVNHQKLPENEPLSVSLRASHLLRCLTPTKKHSSVGFKTKASHLHLIMHYKIQTSRYINPLNSFVLELFSIECR